jgi:glyoxylase-like metal-dependent hydrolase (beta-lactamase superfamily II)
MFTVGPVQENAYIVTADREGGRAVMVDPGEEPERLLAAARALGVEIEAILITHCHFDHIGAVAPVARATGAPVYCPEIERPLLRNIMAWVPPGFGPFEDWEPEHTLAGGERLTLAGLDIEVLSTPGHSPGHLTYAIAPSAAGSSAAASAAAASAAGGSATAGSTTAAPTAAGDSNAPVEESDAAQPWALLSGDVLFEGSVGRVDLPGGDWNVLERSIGTLLESFPGETVVYPGHMGVTTLGRELQTNPFLAELRSAASAPAR